MTFPWENDGAPRRGRAPACKADSFVGVIQFPAFFLPILAADAEDAA